jgi:phosphatidylethanolamine/phosphatidyl-N-methylethanolamine N-methyltransferase
VPILGSVRTAAPAGPGQGAVAQLGEHLLCKQGVAGSIPVRSIATARGTRRTRPRPMPSWNRLRYALYAPLYDAVLARAAFVPRGRRRSLALAGPVPGERVLLVAAGTGLDLPHLPAGLRLVAVDLTPAMLRRAVRRAAAMARPLQVGVADAARLPFADATFDCVVLHLALAVVPDPAAALREAVRTLRPRGRVAIFDKFLADDARPSLLRRLAAAVTRVVATDLNVQLGPLAAGAGLRVTHREPVGPGELFVVARAERPGP